VTRPAEKEGRAAFAPCALVPVYNNAATLKDVVAGCRAAGLPVVVVDDGSTDGSGASLGAPPPGGVDVVRLPRNRGKGAALREGFARALALGYTHAVAIDADGQHDPAETPTLLAAARAEPDAIVVGARAMREGGAPRANRFGRAFSRFWLRVQTGRRVEDPQSGFRVYPLARAASLGTVCPRYEMEHEILVRAAVSGVPIRSVPVTVRYGAEVVSHFRKLHDTARHAALNAALVGMRGAGLLGALRRDGAAGAGWRGRRTLGNRWGYAAFEYTYRAGGIGAAYRLLRPVAEYYARFSPPAAREASLAYLRIRFPGATERELRRGLREHVWQFSQTMLDRVVISIAGFDDYRMRSTGIEHIERARDEGMGVVFLGAHAGNFEVGGFALAGKGIRIRIVGVRKEMERIERYVHERYRRSGLQMDTLTIRDEQDLSFLEIPRALARGEVLAMLGDREWGRKSIPATLLGRRVRFPAGPLLMASLTGAPVVVWFVMKDDERTYHFHAFPPFHVRRAARGEREAALAGAAAVYAGCIEEMLRDYPYQWYNFFDYFKEPAP